MSDSLYLVRLRWDGRRGVAKNVGGFMTLSAPPNVGFPFSELDYAPPVCALVRPYAWHALRDMSPEERAACVRYLRAMDAVQPDLDQPVDTATGLECGMPVHVGRKA